MKEFAQEEYNVGDMLSELIISTGTGVDTVRREVLSCIRLFSSSADATDTDLSRRRLSTDSLLPSMST
jgi:hypothetical protein